VERQVTQKVPNIHLEAMEEAENQVPKSMQAGHPREIRPDGGYEQKRILAHGGNHDREKSHLKRKLARTGYH